jgi:hypothetical protein
MLKRVRLELARSREFPGGSTRHGYEVVMPLDEGGRVDRATWEKAPEVCTVHRFWEGDDDLVGELVHPARDIWAFSYFVGDEDDEPIHRLEDHVCRPGEYLSVRGSDGEMRAFRIVLVEPALALRSQ